MAQKYIGAPIRRKEDKRFLTGQGQFVDDVTLPNLHHAAILRSPHAHAWIRSIDTSKAEAYPGVKAVVTSADLPNLSNDIGDQTAGAMVNYGFFTRNILAVEKGLYKGHVFNVANGTTELYDTDLGFHPRIVDGDPGNAFDPLLYLCWMNESPKSNNI